MVSSGNKYKDAVPFDMIKRIRESLYQLMCVLDDDIDFNDLYS
jgi:hypothetical protein